MKEIKRGYVVWNDEDGFHKEPLVDHPELLAKATPKQQLAAEEVRRLNEEGERRLKEMEEDAQGDVQETLEVLKKAPPEVLKPDQLAVEDGHPIPELASVDDGFAAEKSEEDGPSKLTAEEVKAQPEEK